MLRPMRIHASIEPSEAHRDDLRRAAPGITFGEATDGPVDVLVSGRPSDEAVAAIAQDGALVIPYSGVPRGTLTRLQPRPDVRLYNLHHNAELVAEHAIALLLAASRRLVPADRELRAGDWTRRYQPDDSPQLRGQLAVIAGHGAIGRAVGAALRGLGMSVAPVTRTEGLDALDALLPRARAVIIALPLTPETEGSFDARRLALLPPTAILVNVARGPIVDEAALFEALRSGQLYGAGLDVWWRYPKDEAARSDTPAAEHPFHELDNVVLSPHRAGHAAETEAHRIRHLADLLTELCAGREPPTRVDRDRGY
ncbi:MAG: hypothetical protein KTR31_22565 [Myxococcales bacterium]|nr:hypothetical protein [Myxococcales bacterium]